MLNTVRIYKIWNKKLISKSFFSSHYFFTNIKHPCYRKFCNFTPLLYLQLLYYIYNFYIIFTTFILYLHPYYIYYTPITTFAILHPYHISKWKWKTNRLAWGLEILRPFWVTSGRSLPSPLWSSFSGIILWKFTQRTPLK